MKSAEHRALRTEDRGLRHTRLRHRPGIECCDGGLDCRDLVEIEACRKLAKTKAYRVSRLLEKARVV